MQPGLVSLNVRNDVVWWQDSTLRFTMHTHTICGATKKLNKKQKYALCVKKINIW
jgi:hypothetical protein